MPEILYALQKIKDDAKQILMHIFEKKKNLENRHSKKLLNTTL